MKVSELTVDTKGITVRIQTKDGEIFMNTNTWEKDKLVEYRGMTLKPIGYVEAKDNPFKVMSNLINLRTENHDFNYQEFYELCRKKGCKRTDLFLCIDGPNYLKGKILLPLTDKLTGVIEEHILIDVF